MQGRAETTHPPTLLRLKTERKRDVWLVRENASVAMTVKTWSVTPWRLFKLSLGITQAQRQHRGTKRVQRAGVPVTEVVSGCRIERWQHRWCLTLKLAWQPGESAWTLLTSGQVSESQQIQLASRLGTYVRQIATIGYLHRDLKLDNVIATLTAVECELTLIDAVGVRRSFSVVESIIRMLDRLFIQPLAAGLRLSRPVVFAAVRAATASLSAAQRKQICQQLRTRFADVDVTQDSTRPLRAAG